MNDWLFWQIIDSSFPTGGFAHSAGLEAAWQHGELRSADDLSSWISIALRQAVYGLLPATLAVLREPDGWTNVDRFVDAATWNHVANRASRAQGRSLAVAVNAVIKDARLLEATYAIRDDRTPGHLCCIWGLVSAARAWPQSVTAEAVLFSLARSSVSAAVRLGMIGPMKGQSLLASFAGRAGELAATAEALTLDDWCQVLPHQDLVQGTQDRLYSRLFQS